MDFRCFSGQYETESKNMQSDNILRMILAVMAMADHKNKVDIIFSGEKKEKSKVRMALIEMFPIQ